MILRRIRVEGWRCFADGVQIGPLGDGLNVIHGPNGSGKSTLMWALARGLFDRHDVTGKDIEALQPWGRDLNPRVTIEFEHAGERYELDKQFLHSTRCELRRWENGSFVRLAESTQADQLLRDMLSADPPKRGASTDRHWGFAQVLWATQGALQIQELSDGTRNTIRDSLGAQVAGPGAGEIEQRVETEYRAIYTPTGKLRSGANEPVSVRLQSQLDGLTLRRGELAAKLAQFDDATRRIEDLNCAREQADQRQQELDQQLARCQQEVEAYTALLGSQQPLAEKETYLRAQHEQLKSRIVAVEESRTKQTSLAAKTKQLEDEAPSMREQLANRESDAELAKVELSKVRGRRSQIDADQSQAHMAAQFVAAMRQRQELARRIEEIKCAQLQLNELTGERSKILAPDAKTWKAIQQAARRRDDAQARLDAALITVTFTPHSDAQIEILEAEQTGPRTLPAGQPLKVQGAPEVAFEIDGVGTVRATGPSESVQELREQLQTAGEQIQRLTTGFGSDDLGQLERACEAARELDGRVSAATVRLKTLLGEQQLADLHTQHAKVEQTVQQISAKHPAWLTHPPDADGLAQQAEAAKKQFVQDVETQEQRRDAAEKTLSAAQVRHTRFAAELDNTRRQLQDVDQQLAKLTDDGLSNQQRKERLQKVALEWDVAQAKLKEAAELLEKFGDDPRPTLAVLRGQREALGQEAVAAQRQLIVEDTRLRSIIDDAPYTALAEVEEEIARINQEIRQETGRYRAIRLLRDLIQEEKRKAVAAVIEPVQQRANRLLQRIAGGRFESIDFDDTFLPKGVAPRSHNQPVVLDLLSGGEQEQVHFAVRLALAEVAFGQQRQLVVLDDPFTATDTFRLARIIRILEEAAQRFQIVLLSCHPERYRHLGNVDMFDLVQLASGTAEGAA